jgi:hypothetical protein
VNRKCYGYVWIRVIFQNDKSYVRATDLEFEITDLFYNELLLSSLLPVKASFEPFSKPYNNIKINFDQWLFGVEELSQKQRVWCAATSINAVANMHNLCLQENINIPPYLDIFLMFNIPSAAWMSHYGGINQIIWAQLLNLISGPYHNPAMLFLPDILLDRNDPHRRFSRVPIHEMTHASHFTNVNVTWYQILTQTEFDNGGHGNGNEPNAGYVAIAESWANHIEAYYIEAPIGYNLNMDNIEFENPFDLLIMEWIPDGLYYDLMDNFESVPTIVDNGGGFNNAMMFDVLDATTRSISEFETNLWNTYNGSPLVTFNQNDLILLVDSYGF